ncbi:hypothetical protein GCM10010399_58530 [Dactylosporangium fulvum]|uniref:DNA recombination protein RmuC n=1 Tax=Dactylosporangium fulvum TaxID=53359 RepID=A0ABY5W7F7_9ACTN|nr:hypothetical protein [Dactylosporangium fulvum]UWP86018.1 hypothetical protein Dfulv_17890 [Dactylosporangium fulvum]
MAWLISGGIVLFALVLLAIVAAKAAGSLRRFGIAAASLQRRLLDGQHRVEPHLAQLQTTVEAMQPRLTDLQDKALVLQARRGAEENS